MQNARRRYGRRSIRLKGYNYATPGRYFVTIVTQYRRRLFGELRAGAVELTDAGRMVQAVWDALPEWYPGVEIDEFVVMPDHIHGIIVLTGAGDLSLPDVVHRLKSLTTSKYIDGVKYLGWPPFRKRLWQRNYHERIVRSAVALYFIRRYIRNNPRK